MAGFSHFTPHVHTSQNTPDDVSSIEIAELQDGELAYSKFENDGVTPLNAYYRLDRTSTDLLAPNQTLVTRGNNPQYGGDPNDPGRWIQILSFP